MIGNSRRAGLSSKVTIFKDAGAEANRRLLRKKQSARPAFEAKVGDVMFSVVGQGSVERDVIVKVEDVAKTGAYNVHTLSGNVMVDGVAATHFTSATTWNISCCAAIIPKPYCVSDVSLSLTGTTFESEAENQRTDTVFCALSEYQVRYAHTCC